MRARFVDGFPEFEGAGLALGEATLRVGAADRPAGDHARERRDVSLRVATVDAECVQLEDFAGKVLVESERLVSPEAAGPFRELRSRSDGPLVVEVKDHGRVLHCGLQQVRKVTLDVGSDRLVFVQAGDGRDGLLVGRDGEVVGPEMHQALGERPVGGGGIPVSGSHLLDVVGTDPAPVLLHEVLVVIAGFASLLAQLVDLDDNLPARGQATDRIGICELLAEPAARVGPYGRDVTRAGAQAKAIGGNDGVSGQGSSPCRLS